VTSSEYLSTFVYTCLTGSYTVGQDWGQSRAAQLQRTPIKQQLV